MYKRVKRCLLPCRENDCAPHALRNSGAKVLLGLIVAAELAVLLLVSPIFPAKFDYLAAVLPGVLVSAANDTRSDEKLGQLTENDTLRQAAQLKADDMAARGYFSHQTPEGRQPWYFLQQAGYSYASAGENLAVNFVDSKAVHRAWMESPTHRANILQGRFTEIGIATAEGTYKGKDVIFVVQFFGTPVAGVAQTSEAPSPEVSFASVRTPASEEPDVMGVEVGAEPAQGLVREIFITKTNPASVSTSGFLGTIASAPISTISTALWILFILLVVSVGAMFVKDIKAEHRHVVRNGVLLVIIIASFIYVNTQLASYWGTISA